MGAIMSHGSKHSMILPWQTTPASLICVQGETFPDGQLSNDCSNPVQFTLNNEVGRVSSVNKSVVTAIAPRSKL